MFIVLLGVGFLLAIYRLLQTHSGFFSYAGLTPDQIDETAKRLDTRCNILSRVGKKTSSGNVRFRGIYLGAKDGSGACSMPLYYHYTPGESFEVYPVLWNELWTTNKDLLNLTGTYVK